MMVLVVDDEPDARKKLKRFLADKPEVSQVLEAADGLEAVLNIKERPIDLVFLDIQMPKLDGLGVVREIGPEEMPPLVFTTAYDQYALAAFDLNAVDYLLKPFDRQRFERAWVKATRPNRDRAEVLATLHGLLGQRPAPDRRRERILVKKGDRYLFVDTADIEYLAAEAQYVRLRCGQNDYLVRGTLSGMEEELDDRDFARVHRSYIVNVRFIREIQPWSHGDYVIVMKNGEEVPLSRRYSDRLLK